MFFGEYPKSDLGISAQVASLAARIHLSRELSLAAGGFRMPIAYWYKALYMAKNKWVSGIITLLIKAKAPLSLVGAHLVQIHTRSKYHKFTPLESSFSQNIPRTFLVFKWKVWMESNLNCKDTQGRSAPVSACTMFPMMFSFLSEFTKIITSLLLVHACFWSENPAVLFSNPIGSKSSLPSHLRVDFWWKKNTYSSFLVGFPQEIVTCEDM